MLVQALVNRINRLPLVEQLGRNGSTPERETLLLVAESLVLRDLERDDTTSALKWISSILKAAKSDPAIADRFAYLAAIAGGAAGNRTEINRFTDENAFRDVDLSDAFSDFATYRIRVAITEVTVSQFQSFLKSNPEFDVTPIADRGPAFPVSNVNWHAAAAYCNWLSKQAGIAPEQWCYEPIDTADPKKGLRRSTGGALHTGFRLLSRTERLALTGNVEVQADDFDLIEAHSWVGDNSRQRLHPVATRMSNRLGLFDMQGNVKEWADDDESDTGVALTLGGGSMTWLSDYTSSISNLSLPHTQRNRWVGFRVAQTREIEE